MGIELNSPDCSRVASLDQSIIDFVSPLVDAAYRRIKRNNYPTPSTSLTGDISRLISNVGECDLEKDQVLLKRNGVTFKQLEQRRRTLAHLEDAPKPKRYHIRNDGTLVHSKRPREETEELDEDFLKGTLKPKKVCQNKEKDVLVASDPINTSSSATYKSNTVKDENGNVLDVTPDVSISSLPDSNEVEKVHNILDTSESDLLDF